MLGPLIRELGLKEVDSGASAVIWVTNDDAVFYNSTERDGLTTVSPVQVYLDLRKNPARGREAADEVLRRYVLPRFDLAAGADRRSGWSSDNIATESVSAGSTLARQSKTC